MTFMWLAIREIQMGTAYAVWTGMGVVGIATYGMLYLGESVNILRISFLLMILIGIIGLKTTSS
jgi:quaternary ammonium compound-resistance protein SugE